jgi:carbonic anhydrase/acetyltransferase-like protein (isoleucine patch superfamily)
MSRTISKAIKSSFGRFFADLGLAVDKFGAGLEYNHEHLKDFPRYRTIFPVEAFEPSINQTSKIAHLSSLIGGVELENEVVVGSGSILRADLNPIRVGERSIIGDYSIMITENFIGQNHGSINIGRDVFIGDKVTLKPCVIDDGAYIGDGSYIQEGAIIERNAVVLPFSVVPAGAIVNANKVWGGNTLRLIRDASKEDLDRVEADKHHKRTFYSQVDQEKVFYSPRD